MEFKLKNYNSEYSYIEYSNNEEYLVFNNASYFIIDVNSDAYKEIISSVGGFVANMTKRYIINNKLEGVSYIMLYCLPQKDNTFLFSFVYLDSDYNILAKEFDNNYFDYEYFKNKFNDCICREGLIYELEEVKLDFCANPSAGFGFEIDGKPFNFDDTFITSDFSIFKEDFRNSILSFGAESISFKLKCNCLNFDGLVGYIYDKDGNALVNYQCHHNLKTLDEYKEKYEDCRQSDLDWACEPYELTLNISVLKLLAKKGTVHVVSA